MFSRIRALFSNSKVEIFFLKDCQQGFKGEIKMVKPNHIKVQLLPHALAQYNMPGFRKRLLPDLDEEELKNKVAKRAQIVGFQRKIQSIAMEFVRTPKFSNPEELKDPIDDEEIIKELNARYKFKVNKKNINLGQKILGYGLTQVQIENYYSPELDDYVNFSVQVLTKKPVVKTSRLFIDEGTGDPTQQKQAGDNPAQELELKAAPEKKGAEVKDKKDQPKKSNQKEKQLDDVEQMLQEKAPKEPKEPKQKDQAKQQSKDGKEQKDSKEQKDVKEDPKEKKSKEQKEQKAQNKQK